MRVASMVVHVEHLLSELQLAKVLMVNAQCAW